MYCNQNRWPNYINTPDYSDMKNQVIGWAPKEIRSNKASFLMVYSHTVFDLLAVRQSRTRGVKYVLSWLDFPDQMFVVFLFLMRPSQQSRILGRVILIRNLLLYFSQQKLRWLLKFHIQTNYAPAFSL